MIVLMAPNVVAMHCGTNQRNCRYDSYFEVVVGKLVSVWIGRVVTVVVNTF